MKKKVENYAKKDYLNENRAWLGAESKKMIEGKIRECMGCGFCCRQAPCALALARFGCNIDKCPALVWDGARWRCKLVLGGVEGAAENLFIGAGCCSGMNTYQHEGRVPTPDEVMEVVR